jgi:ArsR family transcriptional regulator
MNDVREPVAITRESESLAMPDSQAMLRYELTELHARFCRGLGDPKRLLIIVALSTGEQSVGQLARTVGAATSNVSQHLGLLRDLGLVIGRRVDNNVYYRLSDPRIAEVVDLLRAIQGDLTGHQW